MNLYTISKNPNYKRILDLKVATFSKEVLYIKKDDTCKLIIIRKGSANFCAKTFLKEKKEKVQGKSCIVKANTAVFISNED